MCKIYLAAHGSQDLSILDINSFNTLFNYDLINVDEGVINEASYNLTQRGMFRLTNFINENAVEYIREQLFASPYVVAHNQRPIVCCFFIFCFSIFYCFFRV